MGRKRKQIATRPGYVVYLRTSTEEVQAPQRSQDGQRRDIARMLKYYDDLPFVCEFIDNYTGTSADRKAYQDMLRQAHQGAFSHIFASTPDRFGRDDVEALRAIDELTEMGLTVRFAAHPDLDPSHEDDRLYLNILFGMARRESAVIGRRVKHGMLSKLHQGDWPWKAPDGYLNRESRIDSTDKAESLQHTRYRRWVEIDPARAPIWRYAWDLLLDNKTLPAICDALTARGYRLRNGNPFIRANRRGNIVPNIQALSRAFNNWFYAGWIVVPSDWADIKPKTLRGNWKPIVSTEEFEHGLQLLAQRRQKPFAQKRNFYLLQGLVYLQYPYGKLRRMSCSRPNVKRTEKGVAYYRIAGQEQRVICSDVDQQIPYHLKRVQVDSEQIPTIRRVYQQDVHSYTSSSGQESRSLKEALARTKDKELNLWRAYTEHGMHNDVYLKLAQEIQQERTNIENALQSVHQESSSHIEDLDMALHILSQIGERYQLLDRDHQRELLRQLVSKVVIDERGKIIRLELLPPFIYLHAIANGTQIRVENGQITGKTGQQADFSCSTRIGLGPLKSLSTITTLYRCHTDLFVFLNQFPNLF